MRKLLAIFLTLACLLNVNLFASSLIHVFGDSHSREFSMIPNSEVHYLGPITMHRVGRDGLHFLDLRNQGITDDKVAIFAFGEIDARCHIGKIRDRQKIALDRVIEVLVNNYLKTIAANRFLYKNLTCIVYSVTPPTDAVCNAEYPHYGTLSDRINITKKLNARLEQACRSWGIHFLDVYNDYANSDGTLNADLSDGNVHINSAHYGPIYQKLCEILLKH